MREKVKNIEDLEGRMKKTANRVLKGKYRRKNVRIQEREEEPLSEEIRQEIKERQRFNRKKKNTISKEEEDKWKELNMSRSTKVKLLIRKEICINKEKNFERNKEKKQWKRYGNTYVC